MPFSRPRAAAVVERSREIGLRMASGRQSAAGASAPDRPLGGKSGLTVNLQVDGAPPALAQSACLGSVDPAKIIHCIDEGGPHAS